MTINWKVRFQNKVWVSALVALLVTFIYDGAEMLGVVPPVDRSAILALVETMLKVLVALGVLVDPTTAGVSDSKQAMTYPKPKE